MVKLFERFKVGKFAAYTYTFTLNTVNIGCKIIISL